MELFLPRRCPHAVFFLSASQTFCAFQVIMLFSRATSIFLTLLVSTSSAAVECHARVRRCDAGTASPSGYNTTSTGAAAVTATASNNSIISASVVNATAASATASSWPMDLGPGVNASASLTFFTFICFQALSVSKRTVWYLYLEPSRLPKCTGQVMEELEGGDEPRRFRDGMATRVSSFWCWKS